MEPFTAVLGAAGILSSVAGNIINYSAQEDIYGANQDVLRYEQQAEGVRMRAMELDSNRKMLEVMRNQQKASSLALTHATASGMGAGGSALTGGRGEIYGQSADNLYGISAALGFGKELFAINNQITGAKMKAAAAGSTAAMGQGLTSLGGSVLQALPAVRGLAGFANSKTSSSASAYTGRDTIYGPEFSF